MRNDEVGNRIHELEAVRGQIRIWRTATTVTLIVVVASCVGILYNSVHRLTNDDAAQQEFATDLIAGLKVDVVPEVQRMASEALTESRPLVEAQFTKLNDRVPELTDKALEQLSKLKTEVPEQSEKVLDHSFGDVLKKHQAKMKQLFPGITDAQITTLSDNLTEESTTRILQLNDKLLSQHLQALNGIVVNIDKIRSTEAINTAGDQPNWETAVMLVDAFKDQLQELEQAAATPSARKARAASATKAKTDKNSSAKKKEASNGY